MRKEAIGAVFYDVNGCSLSVSRSLPQWKVQYNDWRCTVVARSVRWKDNVNKWASPWVHLLNLSVCHWLLQRKQPELILWFNLRWLTAYRDGAPPVVGFPPSFLLWPSKKKSENLHQINQKIQSKESQCTDTSIFNRTALFTPVFFNHAPPEGLMYSLCFTVYVNCSSETIHFTGRLIAGK